MGDGLPIGGIRAAHTLTSLNREASGPSYSVPRLCRALIDAGAEVSLITIDVGPADTRPPCTTAFPAVGSVRLSRSPAMRRWLEHAARSQRLDIIHNHGLWQMPNVYPGWAARKHRVPLVVAPRGTLSPWAMASGSKMKKVFWPLVQRPAIAGAAAFHATAESEYQDIRNLGFRQPIIILPNGIDLQPLVPRTEVRSRTLLFLGRIHEKKGIDLLLAAWARVEAQHPHWRLRIVGTDGSDAPAGGLTQRLKALAASLQLKQVCFDDALYGAEKLAAYRNADLFVLPSHSENFGMTVAEALSQETPTVATTGTPWAGLATHEAGWWIDLGVDQLAATLDEAMAMPPEVLRAMGARGRAWMAQEFDWTEIGRKMHDAYRWILDPTKPVPAFVRVD